MERIRIAKPHPQRRTARAASCEPQVASVRSGGGADPEAVEALRCVEALLARVEAALAESS